MHRICFILIVCFFWTLHTQSCDAIELQVFEGEYLQEPGTPFAEVHSFIVSKPYLMIEELEAKLAVNERQPLETVDTHESSGNSSKEGNDSIGWSASPDISVTDDVLLKYDREPKISGISLSYRKTNGFLNAFWGDYGDNFSFTQDRIIFDALEFNNTRFRLFWCTFPY